MPRKIDFDLVEFRRVAEIGWSADRIAHHFRVSIPTIYLRSRQTSIRLKWKETKAAMFDPQIADLHSKGFRRDEICDQLGIGRRIVETRMRSLGLKMLGARVGVESHRWRGGRLVRRGYVLVFDRDHPNANSIGYVREHIKVMSEKIGRPIYDGEVVHHLNHDRSDNRIENLQLMSSSEHRSLHARERWISASRSEKARIVSRLSDAQTEMAKDGRAKKRSKKARQTRRLKSHAGST